MVVAHLTQAVCNRFRAEEKRYDVRDTQTRGLFLRVEASGRKTWYISYRTPAPERRLRNKKIAPFDITLAQARCAAKEFLARLHLEKTDPAAKVDVCKKQGDLTLRALLNLYEPWVMSQRKSGSVTMRMLMLFEDFLDIPCEEITTKVIEKWQIDNYGRLKGATINRRIAALKFLMNWAAKKDLTESVPFKTARVPQMDSKVIIRYLSPSEKERLMSVLEKREEMLGQDYLKTAIVLSLNTGIRKGTLMSLLWEDVNFESRTMFLRAAIMKGGKSAVLPLNDIAFESLRKWRGYTGRYSGFVFPGDGTKLKDTRKQFEHVLKEAEIENFTWHCLRHDFASQLAMKGVPLHVIQKLMCHASIDMTQRYAHLSPNSLDDAVRLLEK